MVVEGQLAPDFTLADQSGKKVTLSKLKGSPVVVYFYPKDDTPGCTKEACDFRDGFASYKQAGATILGISPDSQSNPTPSSPRSSTCLLRFWPTTTRRSAKLTESGKRRACTARSTWAWNERPL